jgi:ABC-type sugar transport system permease subunit
MIKTVSLNLKNRNRNFRFLILVVPVFVLRFMTAAHPILDMVYLSLTDLHLIDGTHNFVGLKN